jgi:hypothetical protein
LRVVAVEGDSVDGTDEMLLAEARSRDLSLELVKCNHGGPEFGSTESPERMAALSLVGNAIFRSITDQDDLLVYVESDLFWEPETLMQLALLADERPAGFDVFAPLVMAGECFYDIWGFRGLDGRRFAPFSPFFPGVLESDVFEVSSVGSCLAMRGHVARSARIRNEGCLVGWCEDARAQGFRIGVVPSLKVRQA